MIQRVVQGTFGSEWKFYSQKKNPLQNHETVWENYDWNTD